MSKIEIFEQTIKNGDNSVGKVAILRGGLNAENPTAVMNDAVLTYVGNKGHNQFIEIHLDNPWVRVVISGINDVNYTDFNSQRL